MRDRPLRVSHRAQVPQREETLHVKETLKIKNKTKRQACWDILSVIR